jgi:hypothetical protein
MPNKAEDRTPNPLSRSFPAGTSSARTSKLSEKMKIAPQIIALNSDIGSPMRRASEMSHVKGITTLGPHNMAAVSRKDWEASKAYGTHVVPLRKVRAQGAVASLAHIPDGERVYVSIDIDSFDPSIAPGTATIIRHHCDPVNYLGLSGQMVDRVLGENTPTKGVAARSASPGGPF